MKTALLVVCGIATERAKLSKILGKIFYYMILGILHDVHPNIQVLETNHCHS